jgi:pyruvate kinase
MRRAKIVATLGPATSSYEQIRAIIDAGVDVARMNLSHGSYEVHEGVYREVRRASDDSGRAVAVLVDLQGPKIRLARFKDGPQELAEGDVFTITTEDVPGTKDECGTTFKGLPQDVKPGDPLLIDDGRVRVKVLDSDGVRVRTEVVVGGTVSNNKGINLPGVAVNVPALSEKDEADLRWGLRLGADLIALSFVRSPDDVVRVREIMDEEGRRIPVIAKIEKPQAVDNLEAIIDTFDGVMVARGDLGVELPLEAVPIVQKEACEISRRLAKPVIVATQMLDGADAVMLSGETSVGEYPVTTVKTMARIIQSTEEHGLERILPLGTKPRTQGGAITLAAAEVADFVNAKFLCVFTESGDSVRRMVRLRSQIPVLAFTPEPGIRSRLALSWGVETFLVPRVTTTDELMHQVDDVLLSIGRIERGEKVVVIAGSPPGIPGSTNDMRVHIMGDAIGGAAPAYQQFRG